MLLVPSPRPSLLPLAGRAPILFCCPNVIQGRATLPLSSGTNPGGPIPIASDWLTNGNMTPSALVIVHLAGKVSLYSCSLLATMREAAYGPS